RLLLDPDIRIQFQDPRSSGWPPQRRALFPQAPAIPVRGPYGVGAAHVAPPEFGGPNALHAVLTEAWLAVRTEARWSARSVCTGRGSLRLTRPRGGEPPDQRDRRLDDLVGLLPGLAGRHLTAGLADHRGQHRDRHAVERTGARAEQHRVLPDPLPAAGAPHQLETGRPVPVHEHPYQVAPLPGALEDGTRPGDEQLDRVGHPRSAGLGPRGGR